jgi:uncharacterized protein
MASEPRASVQARVFSAVSLQERIDVVDILRGFAIFGMLVVNFSHDLGWDYLFTNLWPGVADRVAYFSLHFFAKGKFYTLFSFLFGWGFALQMGRAEARGVVFFPVYARRLLVLLLIGLANWIFWDETLFEYALVGYLLFLFRARSLKTVLVVALICLCYWPVSDIVIIHNHARRLADPRTAEITGQSDARAKTEEATHQAEHVRIASEGSFKQNFAYDAREAASELSSQLRQRGYTGVLGYPFPILLLGLYVGRRRILQDVPAHLGFIRKVFWWGLSLGLVGNGVGVMVAQYPGPYKAPWDKSWVGDAAFYQIGIPALCFFYASGIVLLAERPGWKLRLAPLAPVGRMALSNYLFHALIFNVLTKGYGLGFYGKMGPLLGAALAVLIFPLLVLFSAGWLKRFRFGPVEWLWRTLTYGELQPMRLAIGNQAATTTARRLSRSAR